MSNTVAQAGPNKTADIATVPGGITLADLRAIAGDEPQPFPDMPALGDKVLLEAVFGRMVNSIKPTKEQELDIGKITRTEFDAWHVMQWKAGKIRRADA